MSVMTDIVEALLFASGSAISEKDLVDKVQGLTKNSLVAVKKDLAKKYPKDGSGVVFLEFNGKLQFSTNPKYGDAIAEILTPLKEKELTTNLLEVLSTIAYKQPITKLELEEMRGVNSDYAITALLKAGLIEVVGRKDALGRPILYGTTDEFLKKFELESLEDLPDLAEVMSKIQMLYQPQQEALFTNRSIFNSEEQIETAEVVEETPQIEETTESKPVEDEKPAIDPYDTDEKDVDEDDDEIPDFLKGEDIKSIE